MSARALLATCALVAMGASRVALAQPPDAASADRGYPSLRALCRSLEGDGAAGTRCATIRRAEASGVEAAALRLTSDRSEQIVLATRDAGRWRVVRFAASAYSVSDARGAIELRSFRVHRVIPGGPPELDVTIARWQGTLDRPDACFVRRVREVHRYVCAERGTGRLCVGLEIEARAGETVVLEGPCSPPPWPDAPAAWAIELSFTPSELRVEPRRGTPPEIVAAWLGVHPLDEVFLPLGTPPRLPGPPDTL